MAEDKQGGSGFGGNSLILLAVAAASAVYMAWQKPPLEGSRPSEADYQIRYSGGTQNVDARMWQDPFVAVSRHLESAQTDKPDAVDAPHRQGSHQLAELLKGAENEETLVVAVTLPGAPYEEDAEERRRLRYAVLAALHAEKYRPADEEHIGYVETGDGQLKGHGSQPDVVVASSARSAEPYANTIPNDQLPPLPPTLPFEWFDATTEQAKHIVVIWLNESVLASGRRPIGSLLRLRDELRLPSTAKFVLIGPHDSTTLMAMVAELEARKAPDLLVAVSSDPNPPLSSPSIRLPVYNFAATVDDWTLLRRAKSSATSLDEYFAAGGIDYYRTVTTDGTLATALVNELKLHNVDLYHTARSEDHGKTIETQDHRDHIALISEWDTVYGQSMPEAMARALAGRTSGRPDDAADAGPRIMNFGYLRGLDGQFPGARSAKPGKSSTDRGHSSRSGAQSSATADNAAGALESAEGQSQFDYLRRLADHVRQRDEELRQRGEGRIAAIGVLGSDVYDKLLILQALRPELPEAQFFTTDLDALLLPRGEFGYTRNLIVASSYDLKLRDAVQADIPPFRSAYQTSVFLTTRLVVENEPTNASGATAGDKVRVAVKNWLTPRLFQIGRTGAFPLPISSDGPQHREGQDQAGSCAGDIMSCPSVQPPVKELFSEITAGSFISVSLLVASLAVAVPMSSRRVRRACFAGKSRSVTRRLAPVIIVLATALVGAFVLCAFWPKIADWLTQYGSGEPILFFEGISVWPTILLRAVGLGLCIWLICRTLQKLELNIRNTEKEMQLRTPRLSILRQPYIHLRGRSFARRLLDMVSPSGLQRGNELRSRFPNENHRPSLPILHLSVRYSYEGRPAPRLMRAAAGTLAMVLLWMELAPIFGEPNVPARGDLALYLYRVVTSLDVIATLFLIFLVADATLYSRSFIKQLTAIRSEWPAKTVDHFARTLGLRGENLDDWIDMQFLAKRTQCITSLIYYPFLMIALLLVSRSRIFDDFTTPATLVITQAISVTVIIGSVFALRSAAEEARASATEHLASKIIAAKGAEQLDVKVANQLEMMLTRIQNLRDGAFAPLSSQPFVKALLLPLLSYGGSVIVHMYALPGF